MNLWQFLKSKMKNAPNQLVCEKDKSMSFESMIDFAELFAKQIKDLKCCAILCQSELEAAKALLSCIAAGVTAVPLSYRYGKKHCNKILNTIEPEGIITDFEEELQITRLSDSQYIVPQAQVAFLMCTSGTTGIPKGVMLSDDNVIANIIDIAQYFLIDNTDTILISRPLYHCAVLTGEFLTSLVKGCKIRFCSEVFNPSLIIRALEEYQITSFCGTPTLLSMMTRFGRKPDKDSLKHIVISGECLDSKNVRRILETFANADIYHVYGLTEACPRVSYLPPNLFEKYPDCVGMPLNSVSLKILSEGGQVVGANEVGILWVKGPNVMVGYYNDPEKTAKVIKDGWLCTGDIASVNESGLLKIHGRSDNLIIKAGMNIYPQEIERVVVEDPRVYEVCVRGEADEILGIKIVMDVVGEFSNSAEVKDLCKKYLPLYQVPDKINLLKELRKNASGKILRN